MNPSDTTLDERIVDTLLAESGEHQSDQLKPLLLQLRSLAHSTAPAPSAELAELMSLMTGSGVAGNAEVVGAGEVVSLSSWRRGGRRAALVVALAVTMGLGAGAAAAASPDFRATAQQVIENVMAPLTGVHPITRPAPPVRNLKTSVRHPQSPAATTPGAAPAIDSPAALPSPAAPSQHGEAARQAATTGSAGNGTSPVPNSLGQAVADAHKAPQAIARSHASAASQATSAASHAASQGVAGSEQAAEKATGKVAEKAAKKSAGSQGAERSAPDTARP